MKNTNTKQSKASLSFIDIINGLVPPQPPARTAAGGQDEDPFATALVVGQASGTIKEIQRLLELIMYLSPGHSTLPKLYRLHVFPFGRRYHIEFAALFPLRRARLLAAEPWPSLKPYITSIDYIYPIPRHEPPLLTGLDCEVVGLSFDYSVSGQFGPVLKDIIRQLPFGWALVSGEKPIRDGDEFPEAYVEILFPHRGSKGASKRALRRKRKVEEQLAQIARDQAVSGYVYHREPGSTINQVTIWIP